METKIIRDAGKIQQLRDIVDGHSLPSFRDAATVQRFHKIAKSIGPLTFNSVWPTAMTDADVGGKRLPLFLGLISAHEKSVVDLADLPHLIVGGTSGHGKSNLLNTVICGLARLLPPDELRLVLVDLKCVEIARYAMLPHLAFPVITDANKCLHALRLLVAEMDRRLKLFAMAQCPNIEAYREGGNPIPYLVVIIDEFAGLMLDHRKDFEPIFARLTARANVAGIHLIMATQRSDRDVLSGTLLSSLPGRIAFKTKDQHESRRLINSPDAELLCSPGDMIFKQREESFIRAQCAYISTEEVRKIVEELTSRYNRPAFLAEIPDAISPIEPRPPQDGPSEEDLYKRALEVVRTTGKVSTSHLQIKMGIGYNVAFRLIDLLEERGVIGPAVGGQPRAILL